MSHYDDATGKTAICPLCSSTTESVGSISELCVGSLDVAVCPDCGEPSPSSDWTFQEDEDSGADYVRCPSCECFTEASALADTGGEGFSVCPQCGHVGADEEFIAGE